MGEDDRPAFAGPLGRLKKRAEFQRVSRGARKSMAAFTLQSAERAPADAASGARVGFTVTKKVGASVVRNRIRRRLKAALDAAPPLEARPAHDYVVMARREALSEPFAALVGQFRDAFLALAHGGRDRRAPGGAGSEKRKSEDRRK